MAGTMVGAQAANANANAVRQYPLPTRDFTIEIPSPQLAPSTNGANSIKSPSTLKSARTPSFSREGILGSAQKARNLSQSSDNRPDNDSNGLLQKAPSEEGSINPLKRRNTDAAVDYPRRRATIAVRHHHPALTRVVCNCCWEKWRGGADQFAVRGLPFKKVALRRNEAKMQTVHRARRGVHIPRARHQVGRGR